MKSKFSSSLLKMPQAARYGVKGGLESRGREAANWRVHYVLMDRSPNVAQRAMFGGLLALANLPIETWMARATSAISSLSRTRLKLFQLGARKACVVGSLATAFHCTSVLAQEVAPSESFPATPVAFIDDPFDSCEGIGFNGLGHLYVTCNRALWRVHENGTVAKIADLDSNLGVAGIGVQDVLVADFGPTNAFRDGRNTDGIVWRITPDGKMSKDAMGIGDPNFILVRSDGSYLVSDDATSDIYVVRPGGEVDLFTTAVNHPNGMVLSKDESTLFVAQMFTNIRPVVGVGRIWAIKLENGSPVRDAKLAVQAGPEAFVDGLALDAAGRVYITANRTGKIWRFDPNSEEMMLIAEGVFGAASVVFGEGAFDSESIYVTTTFSDGRGGKVWRIPVGIKGATVTR